MINKLQSIGTLLALVSAIGGGFYTWGVFNNRLEVLESASSVGVGPINEKIVTLETKVDNLEKTIDKLENNNKNPLAQ